MIDRTQWLPRILSDIREDARHGRFDAWGRSTVIDENTATPVLGHELFDELHAAAGIDANYPVGNAGVLHVYGYWFSDEPTPYGYKRDRWVDGALAAALGLAPDAFHLGGTSTLLTRVADAVLPALRTPPANARGTADVTLADARSRVVILGTADASALVYGIDHGDGFRLITTFPLAGNPQDILDDFAAHPRYRWNADDPSKTSPEVHLNVDI